MKTSPIAPAHIVPTDDGAPWSPLHGDRYHPASGALAQATHVFLRGNGLPERWQGREDFVILETGFGLGNNFLATWDAWRRDPRRSRRLHFISIEKHPLRRVDLARWHAGSPLPALAASLLDAWPPLTHNLHRLVFDQGQVQLSLAFGDVADWLREIVARVDAYYLDGFAPARNPQMWQPRLYKAMARLAAPLATAATWSAARAVRDGLAAAGFEVSAAPGQGGKRDITLARYAPRFEPRLPPGRSPGAPAADRHALIVGAGLAGCAAAWALAEQGWSSTVLDRHDAPAQGASGNAAGLFHGVVHGQDATHARFNRAAALQAADAVAEALQAHRVRGSAAGLLRLEFARPLDALQRAVDALGLPPEYVQPLDPGAASEQAGVRLSVPAWFYPRGGWVEPRGLARAFVERACDRCRVRTGVEVGALRRAAQGWQVLDATGAIIEQAATVVLANAGEAATLAGAADWPLARLRGQTTGMPASALARPPRLPLSGNGYLLPALDGMVWCGATSDADDDDPTLRDADHRSNLARAQRLAGLREPLDAAALAGRVGWRCTAIDRLPVIGAVPAGSAAHTPAGLRRDQPRLVPRTEGLFVFTALASRGITWAALGARSLAAAVSGAPMPLEASLLDAIDPARFVARTARAAAVPD